MTLSQHVEDRFSDWIDDDLDANERAVVRAHLAACESCRTGLEAFERSTRALRGLRLAPTPIKHVQDVRTAIVSSRRPRLALRFLSHAAALLIGIALMWSSRGCAESTSQEPTETVRVVHVEVPVEVRVEVPVEVPVEVIREVPVDVVREVRVEVPVEIIQYVDRPDPRMPKLDVERTYALLADIGGALTEIANARNQPPPLDVETPTAIANVTDGSSLSRPAERSNAPLRIQRDGDRVLIHTRGSLDDVVPALIGTLNDPNQVVARAVEQHLEALRADLAGDPNLAPLGRRIAKVQADRPGGLRGLLTSRSEDDEFEVTPDLHARWSEWWHDRPNTLALAGIN
tara:strand:- start:10008 stop:11039 length:1032 start_codon:yes stop_codon:yes gene_type:complete